ncbi:uncharacterized protein [Dysidea avara]|uniref:uncharacterized protein isoform X1 n=1 Tax=Dysidea avara TaxID=196820 RepID=UPI00331F2D6F
MSIFSEDTDYHEDTEEIAGTSLEPYKLEPIDANLNANASDTDQLTEDESSSDEELLGKLPNDMSWYHCGNCKMMPTKRECICCCSIGEVVDKMEEIGTSCITESEGFDAVCLNQWVLHTAYYQYRKQYGKYKESIHEQYRFTSYRQLTRWCWGWLGKSVRIVPPSCAVDKIMCCG